MLRLSLGLVTVFAFSVIIFSTFSFLPGDFATEILGQSATKSAVKALRAELGLDKPPVTRYFDWLGNVFQGDFGSSFSGRSKVQGDQGDRSREVVGLIVPRLKNTLFLTGVAAMLAIPLSLILGISAALYRNSYYDRSATGVSLVTVSSPEFFTAYIFILLLATLFPVFPTISNVDEASTLAERFYRTALPVFTLTLITAFIDAWKRPFDYKGVTTRKNYWFYVLSSILVSSLLEILKGIFVNLAYLTLPVFDGSSDGSSLLSSFFLVISHTFSIIDVLYSLGALVIHPSIIVRRLRDAGKQWQWVFLYLVPIIGWIWLIVLFCKPTKRN